MTPSQDDLHRRASAATDGAAAAADAARVGHRSRPARRRQLPRVPGEPGEPRPASRRAAWWPSTAATPLRQLWPGRAAPVSSCSPSGAGRRAPAMRPRGVAEGDILFFVDADVTVPPRRGRAGRRRRSPITPATPPSSVPTTTPRRRRTSCRSTRTSRTASCTRRRTRRPARSGARAGRCDATRSCALGGYDERYRRSSIEDIELGSRLIAAGERIRMVKSLAVKHLKRWTPADAGAVGDRRSRASLDAADPRQRADAGRSQPQVVGPRRRGRRPAGWARRWSRRSGSRGRGWWPSLLAGHGDRDRLPAGTVPSPETRPRVRGASPRLAVGALRVLGRRLRDGRRHAPARRPPSAAGTDTGAARTRCAGEPGVPVTLPGRVVVAGAGPAGLAAARDLSAAGVEVLVLEQAAQSRRPRPHRVSSRLPVRHRRAPVPHADARHPAAVGRHARRRLPEGPAALADLLSRPVLRLPRQPGERRRQPGSRGERPHRRQLPRRPDPAIARGADVRGLGDEPVRPPPLRDLLQDLHREGVGHAVLGDRRGLGRAAHSRPDAADGRRRRDREAQPRGVAGPRVPLPAARPGPDVGALCGPRRGRGRCRAPRRRRHPPASRRAAGRPRRGRRRPQPSRCRRGT